ncbi:phosphate transport system permease protein [Glaciecola punicea ACAM 611]|uniref:Phosphate transport system permease protein PstA n=1 Tax=Glaciecola punicea ACAM 611 TaxID=1121923 RepID=H5TDJ7_9ALTE|nr:phosphate ABC transporter permease PstA [Glaciecola punicea]GAB56374.1 phosphate transport system permease protein [Glaciecola punicea ACAM 611]
MISKLSLLTNKYVRGDYAQQFKQSLLEVLAMLACATILIVLVGIFAFIGVQGGRYFMPMSAYQITTVHTLSNAQDVQGKGTSVPDRSVQKEQIQYTLSHLSAAELASSLQQKLLIQYIAQTQEMPKITVSAADSLYQINTTSGQTLVGKFVSLQEGSKVSQSLANLVVLQSEVARLQQNLSDIQIQRLQSLHRAISELDNKQVARDTPLYQTTLAEFMLWQAHANNIIEQIGSYKINIRLDSGELLSLAINKVQDIYQPNQLSSWQSIGYILNKIVVFISDSPKQASTSGGVFPAIFGTLLMVIIMAIIVTPFGAIAAIYLHEYAPDNRLTTTIRICVSNMAAVPSVVYGVFGLGFFVYVLGGSIDSLLYSDKLPSPTFGAPGLLWASLTMGILTLPVVIVATQEGLSRVPSNLRSGAIALGATKYETIVKVVLPMASPGILTGVILAIARAAGEVAPLILVGAVKFAPTLPIDGEFPFVHLERQFMHLGVFIYDGAFHNQTESQVSSLMFASCMLLLLVVLLLNLSAILLRNKLRNKYERL